MRFSVIIMTLLFAPNLAFAQETAAQETAAAKGYAALLAEYEEEGGARLFAKRFLAFAQENIKDPVAADALFWLVENVRGRREAVQAIGLLEQHHLTSDRMGPGSEVLAVARTVGAEKLLRATIEKHKDQQVQAVACFYLAQLLDREANIIEQLRANPQLAPRVLQYYGKEYGAHLASLKLVELAARREKVYEQLLKSFGDVEIDDEKMETIAEKALYVIRHLSVGKIAPEIKGIGINGDEFKLSDYRGKVVMLSFWGHW